MKHSANLVFLLLFLLAAQSSMAAANLFFIKTYNEDFKKNKTNSFVAGDPIYGLLNVSIITVNDNNITSVTEFADANGNVTIRVYFADLDREISWQTSLASGRVKNNRFLFCVIPESADKMDKPQIELFKILMQLSGKKVNMNVRVGVKDVTAWWQDDLSLDLTNGMGNYNQLIKNVSAAMASIPDTFYWTCESKNQPYVDFRRDELNVTALTDDSLVFKANGTPYRAKKKEGYNFLHYQGKYESFIGKKLDNNSFLIYTPDDVWSYYTTNKNLKDEQDINKRCPLKAVENLKVELKPYLEAKDAEADAKSREKQKQDKLNLTKWVHDFASRRNDPNLEKKIIQWWNNNSPGFPVMRVFFLGPEFSMVRDEYNQVLRKIVPAMIIYKGKNNTCWAQWSKFGYEHLGGGAFAEELTSWKAGYKEYSYYQFDAAGVTLEAAQNYEMDCALLSK